MVRTLIISEVGYQKSELDVVDLPRLEEPNDNGVFVCCDANNVSSTGFENFLTSKRTRRRDVHWQFPLSMYFSRNFSVEGVVCHIDMTAGVLNQLMSLFIKFFSKKQNSHGENRFKCSTNRRC